MDEDRYDMLLWLYLHPTRKGFATHPHRIASRNCSTCGDHLQMGIWTTEDVITDARFEGQGCVISEVSASLTTELIIGKRVPDLCLIEANHILAPFDFPLAPAKRECALLSWRVVRLLVASEILQRL